MSTARQLLATGLMGLLGATAFVGNNASAQQIYRIVGPDGKVTFSDQAPPQAPAAKGAAVPVSSVRGVGAVEGPALPFELRNAASRYPVTLYTSPNCDPCASARTNLAARGIPFTEKTVGTNEDLDAIKRMQGGSASVPMLTIGGQQLKGYNETEWTQFLDAAGYPKTSILPPNYRQVPPSPVIAVQVPVSPASAPSRSTQAAAPGAAPRAPAAAAENPAGIRF
ncbi:MAG: glutaredoxin family protein [Ramlibacter sp.]|nr:glutaredoxin family protein [Ramlibacter sp.]